MILYFQFKLKAEVRKEEAFLDLQTRIEGIGSSTTIDNLITSTKGDGVGIIEVNIPSSVYQGNGYSFDIMSVDAVLVINTIAQWAENTADYTMAVNNFSVVDKIMETITDKNIDTLLKWILLSTGAKTLIGKFDINDIPHDEETLKLI